MKAIELLKDYRNIDFGCDVEGLHNEIDKAIKDLESLELYVKSLEEYRRLVISFLQIEKCSCGTLKVKGYLCSNKKCTEE